MGRLVLVGLGLGSRGIPLRGLDVARGADTVFLETYTAVSPHAPDELAELVGRPVEPMERARVEDGAELLDAARDGTCVLLVAGDALSATTHVSLRMQAREAGVECTVVPAASIMCAVPGVLGLSSYKFGRTTTLVYPRPNFAPESPYDVVAANRAAGLHTLVLLDITDDETGLPPADPPQHGPLRCMTAAEGAARLGEIARSRDEPAIDDAALVAAVARVGEADEAAYHGPLARVAATDIGPPMHSLVVPGELSQEERDALEALTRRL